MLFNLSKSFLFALRIIMDMNGDKNLEKPFGFPRLRNVILVECSVSFSQV